MIRGTLVDVSSVLEGFWNSVIGLWGDLSVMVLNLTKCCGVFLSSVFGHLVAAENPRSRTGGNIEVRFLPLALDRSLIRLPRTVVQKLKAQTSKIGLWATAKKLFARLSKSSKSNIRTES